MTDLTHISTYGWFDSPNDVLDISVYTYGWWTEVSPTIPVIPEGLFTGNVYITPGFSRNLFITQEHDMNARV